MEPASPESMAIASPYALIRDAARAPVVVLADRCYSRRFGADPAVVGSTLRINGA